VSKRPVDDFFAANVENGNRDAVIAIKSFMMKGMLSKQWALDCVDRDRNLQMSSHGACDWADKIR